jgi:hypothetical protein
MTADATGVLRLTVEVGPDAVLRGLGYQGGRASTHVRRRLEVILEEAVPLLAPRGSYRIVEGTRAAALGVPNASLEVGLALCTVGARLEDEVARRSADDRLLEALILDTIGSVAAEAAADALNRELCGAARARGRFAGPRCSPGYPGWELERQPELLAMLPAGLLGVSLTDGVMMVPRKSVSFAVPLLKEPPLHDGGACSRCSRPDCTFRRSPRPGAGG